MATHNYMNTQNAEAMIDDLLAAFPDETVQPGRRLNRDQVARLNAAIVRAKDIRAGMVYAQEHAMMHGPLPDCLRYGHTPSADGHSCKVCGQAL